MNISLNRIQYEILNILRKRHAKEAMFSLSCNEISEESGHTVPTIYKHVRILESYGYVTKGAKVERANGYIITKEALDMLPEEIIIKKKPEEEV